MRVFHVERHAGRQRFRQHGVKKRCPLFEAKESWGSWVFHVERPLRIHVHACVTCANARSVVAMT
ncbi:hypothetical protein D7X96_15800 [Corallococcus interemptor]|uniref:Uncharacterized protein n=1 Tax=Corallococcus interemptor TaxID=2316720 RepID=A0A3A8R181_9BACT|nr:hypothetical protein D7X96_15800 [Corallococcus interemptor]